MTEQRKLLSDDQMSGIAEIWARGMIKPLTKHGQCECGHMGTINTENGLCMWCQPRRKGPAA